MTSNAAFEVARNLKDVKKLNEFFNTNTIKEGTYKIFLTVEDSEYHDIIVETGTMKTLILAKGNTGFVKYVKDINECGIFKNTIEVQKYLEQALN